MMFCLLRCFPRHSEDGLAKVHEADWRLVSLFRPPCMVTLPETWNGRNYRFVVGEAWLRRQRAMFAFDFVVVLSVWGLCPAVGIAHGRFGGGGVARFRSLRHCDLMSNFNAGELIFTCRLVRECARRNRYNAPDELR
jgi:hypothetical protein